MQGLDMLKSLPPREQALVVIAVLLDGREGAQYLQSDLRYGEQLSHICRDLALLSPDLRMPLLGTILRRVLPLIR